MAERIQFDVHDIECSLLNQHYIATHYSEDKPRISPGLKAQVVLNEKGFPVRIFCDNYHDGGCMVRRGEDDACICLTSP